MCLLVVMSRAHPDAPLVVAANRDEYLSRPARAMTVLQAHGPRILGGRDDLAGGTWFAVNEAGVAAGLTNRPASSGRDASKRSRGELPLALAGHRDAASAAEDFVARFRPADYSPAWLLVGDRDALFFIDLTGDASVGVEELEPGVHVLENRPLHAPSAKVSHVRALLTPVTPRSHESLVAGLVSVLADHHQPRDDDPPDEIGGPRPPETLAACVHAGEYGTASAPIVTVPHARAARPRLCYSGGPLSQSALRDASQRWDCARPSAW